MLRCEIKVTYLLTYLLSTAYLAFSHNVRHIECACVRMMCTVTRARTLTDGNTRGQRHVSGTI